MMCGVVIFMVIFVVELSDVCFLVYDLYVIKGFDCVVLCLVSV